MENGETFGQKTVFELALLGKVAPETFRSIIREYVRDQNSLAKKTVEVTLNKNTLDFVHEENAQVPVVDFDSDRTVQGTLTLNNVSRTKKYYFEVVIEPNPKFDIKPSVETGSLKKGKPVEITFSLRAFCTTLTYQLAKIVLYDRKLQSKFGSVMGRKYCKCGNDWANIFPQTRRNYDELEIGPRLARGGFGTVYAGKWRGAEVAIKMLQNVEHMVEEELEADCYSKLAYAHIVTYMGATQIRGQPFCIIMEYIKGGSLSNLLKKPLSDRFKCKLALDVAKGMNYLHGHKIFHRDIKPDNVLVVSDQEGPNVINLKITDFGTARIARQISSRLNDPYYRMIDVEEKKDKSEPPKTLPPPPRSDPTLTTAVGTLLYNAPEILSGYSNYAIDKTDVFSYGVLLYELYTQKVPFSDPQYAHMGKWDIQNFVKEGKRLEIPKSVPRQIRVLIERCWDQEPNNRPDFGSIVKDLEALYQNYLKDGSGGTNSVSQQQSPSESTRTKKSSAVSRSSNGIPVPRGTPEELQSIGWSGVISRPDAEKRLEGRPEGYFLLRYSANTKSYVLSYVSKGEVCHIGYIQPQPDGTIYVSQEDKGTATYEDIFEYISAMKENELLTEPLPIIPEQPEDQYGRSPALKRS